mmetsp:Transcript_29520/g.67874  ORF Transcript_29520/g.67874 Transcript_29520/m.67874 type:complete len:159 (+) Transcript_29520:108-584(+)
MKTNNKNILFNETQASCANFDFARDSTKILRYTYVMETRSNNDTEIANIISHFEETILQVVGNKFIDCTNKRYLENSTLGFLNSSLISIISDRETLTQESPRGNYQLSSATAPPSVMMERQDKDVTSPILNFVDSRPKDIMSTKGEKKSFSISIICLF